MKTPSAAHRRAWKKLADEHGLDDHAEALLAYAEPCFVVDRLVRGAGSLGASRLGGMPDLPAGVAWPAREGEHLRFVAQIDLSALAPEWVPDLPRSGWLYVFIGLDEPASDVVHEVLYFDGPREALTPASLPPGARLVESASATDFVAHEIRFRRSLVVDPNAEEALGLEDGIDDALTASTTQVGGLPVAWDDDPRVDVYLLRNGLAPLVGRLHEEPEDLARQAKDAWADANDELAETLERATELLRAYRADEATHRERTAAWRALLVIDSHDEVGTCWWDAGLLQILVHADDLAARRFDRTYCCVSST